MADAPDGVIPAEHAGAVYSFGIRSRPTPRRESPPGCRPLAASRGRDRLDLPSGPCDHQPRQSRHHAHPVSTRGRRRPGPVRPGHQYHSRRLHHHPGRRTRPLRSRGRLGHRARRTPAARSGRPQHPCQLRRAPGDIRASRPRAALAHRRTAPAPLSTPDRPPDRRRPRCRHLRDRGTRCPRHRPAQHWRSRPPLARTDRRRTRQGPADVHPTAACAVGAAAPAWPAEQDDDEARSIRAGNVPALPS
jgi:hypothetical protein